MQEAEKHGKRGHSLSEGSGCPAFIKKASPAVPSLSVPVVSARPEKRPRSASEGSGAPSLQRVYYDSDPVSPLSDSSSSESSSSASAPVDKRVAVVPEDEMKMCPDHVSEEDLRVIAAKVNKFSSAGPSGARMWFYTPALRSATSTAADDTFCKNLCWLNNRVASGASGSVGCPVAFV